MLVAVSPAGNSGSGPLARSESGVRERIRLLVELSRPKEAIALCRKARAQGDHSADLDELEGLAHIRTGDHKAALEALARGLRTAPERAHLHYLWSFAARFDGRADEANKAIIEALRLAPEEPVYLRARAELQSERREHALAIASAQEAVRLGPDRAANYVTLGFVASASGDKALARASYEKALELDPEDASAWNNLGCLDLEAGKTLLARERFRESLRLVPEGPRAKKNLEQTLLGQTLEGYTHFDMVIRALAGELATTGQARLLIALALEAEAAQAVLGASLARVGPIRMRAALGAFAAGAVLALLRSGGVPRLVGAGLGMAASFGAARWMGEERRRVRVRLAADRQSFEAIRRDWLDGRIERTARDLMTRRLVERATLALCEPKPQEKSP